VDIGYFVTGRLRGMMSSGTRASVGQSALVPHYAWRDRQLVDIAAGDQVIGFAVNGQVLPGLSIGGAEHLTIPKLRPWIREVGVYLGGPKSQATAKMVGKVASGAAKVPGIPELVRWTTSLPRVNDGPTDERRAQSGSVVVASAYDGSGRRLESVRLTGTDPYTFTQRMLVWAAMRLSKDGASLKPGALGPVEAFGLDALVEACATAGLRVVED